MSKELRVQRILGACVFVGMLMAGVAGFTVTATAQHEHCTESGCEENGCTANHPGFSCHVTDDNVCNCVGVPPRP